MKYVALLRGINVGGNTKVEMSRLKIVLESLGCKNVSTYINSGNVLFTDSRSVNVLQNLIESAIEKEFGFIVATLVVKSSQINNLCSAIPTSWTNDTEQKTDVMFLWNEINNHDIHSKIAVNPQIENVLFIEGALVWNIARKNVTKGNGIKLIKTDIYKKMTVRNINTVRKLNSLLESITD